MDEADEEEEGNEGTGKGNEAGEHAVGVVLSAGEVEMEKEGGEGKNW